MLVLVIRAVQSAKTGGYRDISSEAERCMVLVFVFVMVLFKGSCTGHGVQVPYIPQIKLFIMKELIEIQSSLKAPKNQYNSFGKYKYRNCEDILEAVKPILKQQKCTLTISDEMVMIGTRYYIKATATLKNSSGEEEKTVAYAREEENKKGMDSSQVTGATSSYARKYALNGLFCIDDNKDSDTTNNGSQSDKKQATEQQVNEDELAMALQEINGAQSLQTLTGIYNNYKQLQTCQKFMSALTAKKKTL